MTSFCLNVRTNEYQKAFFLSVLALFLLIKAYLYDKYLCKVILQALYFQ